MNEIDKKAIIIRWLKKCTKKSYKYWYIQCSDDQKKIYKEILFSLVNLSENVNISYVSSEEFYSIKQIYNYCIQDNPIIFYLNTCTFTIYKDCLTINYIYLYDLNEIYTIISKIDIALKKLEKRCYNKSEIEKEKIVHDCIVRQVIYQKKSNYPVHSCHSVFMHKAAVCDGISKAVKLMLNHVGINAFVVNGDSVSQDDKSETGGHSWNMVYINNELFHIDVTFDNTLTSEKNHICYDYFNLTDSQIFNDHILKDYDIVSAKKIQDFYMLNKLVFINSTSISYYLKQCISQKREYVAFRAESINIEKAVIEKLINNLIHHGSIVKSYKYSINSKINSVRIWFFYR